MVHCLQDAVRLYGQQKYEEAQRLCEAVIRSDACEAEAPHLLGLIAAIRGDYPAAIGHVTAAIALRPDRPEYFFNLGNIYNQSGRNAEAARLYRNALALAPDHAEAWFNLGNSLEAAGNHGEAVQAYREAIRCKPQYAKAWINLANVQRETGEFGEAEVCLRQVLQWAPGHVTARNNLGNLLRETGKLAESLEHLSAALATDKDNYRAWNNYGSALREAGRLREAIEAYREALRLKPDHAEAHLNLSMALLAAGEYAEGWREYEWRWQGARENQGYNRNFPQSQWQGQPLHGETILLHAEQGLGDALQFIRYAPLVAKRGGRVVVECQPGLLALFARIPGIDKVIERGDALPDFSWHCPLMSLPHAFGTTLETVPAGIPYLAPDVGKVAEWKRFFNAGSNLRVGLVWAGNPRLHDPVSHQIDRRRSLHLSQLAPILATPATDFFSLQKGEPQAQLAQADFSLVDLGVRLHDFDDTAALVSLLDLVITVDTSVAHLAGALGRSVWMLSRYDACWRWGAQGETTPWYPSMKIYRQAGYGDWTEPLAAMSRDLQVLAGRPAA